jgi:SET domain-containing protein
MHDDQTLPRTPHVKMHDDQALPRLFVAKTPDRGKGVFTLDAIESGAVVEVAHVIVFTEAEWKSMASTNAYNYVYEWPEHARGAALACGYGSHFNHSADAHNLTHTNNYVEEFISYFALRDIAPGEELLIDYGCEWWHEDDRGKEVSTTASPSKSAAAARP